MHIIKEIAMNNNVPTAIDEQFAGEITIEETPATSAGEDGHGNCSGSGNQGCCGNHRQENPSNHNHHSAKGCCGH
jgi:hypothetical protein